MTTYTITKAPGLGTFYIEWGLKQAVVPYMVDGYLEQGKDITPLEHKGRQKGTELTVSAGGMIWLGGPPAKAAGDILVVEPGSLSQIQAGIRASLRRSDRKHTAWCSLWSGFNFFWAFKRATAERHLDILNSREFAQWDGEYQEGLLDAREKLVKSKYIEIEQPMPQIEGEH